MPIVQLSSIEALTRPATFPPPPRIQARPQELQLGDNQIYQRWEFQTNTIDSLYWQIDTFDPDFDAGSAVTFRLLWTPAVSGTVAWRVGFVSIASTEVFDVGPATETDLDAAAAVGFGSLTISSLVIGAAIPPELIAPGERVTVFLRRDAQAAADTIDNESAFVLGASLEYAVV